MMAVRAALSLLAPLLSGNKIKPRSRGTRVRVQVDDSGNILRRLLLSGEMSPSEKCLPLPLPPWVVHLPLPRVRAGRATWPGPRPSEGPWPTVNPKGFATLVPLRTSCQPPRQCALPARAGPPGCPLGRPPCWLGSPGICGLCEGEGKVEGEVVGATDGRTRCLVVEMVPGKAASKFHERK